MVSGINISIGIRATLLCQLCDAIHIIATKKYLSSTAKTPAILTAEIMNLVVQSRICAGCCNSSILPDTERTKFRQSLLEKITPEKIKGVIKNFAKTKSHPKGQIIDIVV